MGNTWITDMTDLPDVRNPDVDIPASALKLTEYFGRIVEAATRLPPILAHDTDIRCRRRPRRKPCAGNIRLCCDENHREIEWECSFCDDHGIITGWEGTHWDKRVIQLFK